MRTKIQEAEYCELKQNLRDSDYQSLKHADRVLSDEEYEPIRLQRQVWRDRINELELLGEYVPEEEINL